jgi:hypothetical protein
MMNLNIEALDMIEAPEMSTTDGILAVLICFEIGAAIGAAVVIAT